MIPQHRGEGHVIARLARRIEFGLGSIAALVLAIMLVMVLANVVLRYGFHTGLVGAEDIGIWLHVALISLGAPLSLAGPLSMRLDVVVRRFTPRAQNAAAVLADAISVLAGLVLVSGSADIVTLLGGTSQTLGMPEWLRFAFLGGGGVLLLVLLILRRLAAGRARTLCLSLGLGFVVHMAAPYVSLETAIPASGWLALAAGFGLLVGTPLSHAFLAASFMAIPFGSSLPEQAIVSVTVNGMSKFLLLAIPFFLLTGGLLTVSGAAGKLVRFAAALVGHRSAGLAQTVLLTSVLFSGASGSSVANAAFGAATFQPALVKHGYPPAQAGAIIAATSVLDNVIPPSIAFLLLAAATNLSIGALLVGGFVAGAIMAVCLFVAIALTAGEKTGGTAASASERRNAAIAAVPAFGLGVIVVFGIRIGIVTTTEAAALAAVYTLGLALAARCRADCLFSAFRQAAAEASAVGLLIGTAAPFAFLLAVDDVAALVSQAVTALGGSALMVLLLSNLALLLVGLVLDIGAAILLLGPVLLPAAIAAGIDPIHFGVILVVNLMIHGLTPPLGLLIYVVSGVTGVPPSALFRAVLPYLAALLVSLALLCAVALLFQKGFNLWSSSLVAPS